MKKKRRKRRRGRREGTGGGSGRRGKSGAWRRKATWYKMHSRR